MSAITQPDADRLWTLVTALEAATDLRVRMYTDALALVDDDGDTVASTPRTDDTAADVIRLGKGWVISIICTAAEIEGREGEG